MTQNYTDINIEAKSGFSALISAFLILIISIAACVSGLMSNPFMFVPAIILFFISMFIFKGVTTIHPNHIAVLQFFGQYKGTVTNTGLLFINPLMSVDVLSTKITNFSNNPIKVNDKRGNPLEASCMFAWRVKDAAKALFSVEDYDDFIKNQVEGILAQIAAMYAYDSENQNEKSFRKHSSEIALELKNMLQTRVNDCGLEIVDVRFNHLAYAVEIASAMLKKQQAEAMIDARQKIVIGARKMTEELLADLNKNTDVKFNNEDKVKLTINLMTVLVSENGTQPVVQM